MWQNVSNNVMNPVFHKRQGISYWLRKFILSEIILLLGIACLHIVYFCLLVIYPATLTETLD
jgi:hypothetical protein